MHFVKPETKKAGQEYRVFTNDQQIFKIVTQITWWNPDEWKMFFPVLGGMHVSMSFVRCIDTLMTKPGLSDLFKAAFGGVDKMLQRKRFPRNTCALRICAEDVLQETLQNDSVSDFCSMMNKLDSIASKSRTVCMWLDALIWPLFWIMRFVRAGREADWPLHIDTLKRMLSFFAAAGYWYYFRYAIVYLIKISKLPKERLGNYIDGEHAMRYQNGIWNAIWFDMLIETTFMHYGHGPTGMRLSMKKPLMVGLRVFIYLASWRNAYSV